MTIEISPPSVEAKAPVSETKANKNSAASSEKSGTPKGFSAILSALDPGAAGVASADPDLLNPLPSGMSVGDDDTGLATSKEDAPLDATALLAQSLQWLGAETTALNATDKPESANSEGGLNLPLTDPSQVPGGAGSSVFSAVAGTFAAQTRRLAQVPESEANVLQKSSKVKPDLLSTQDSQVLATSDGNAAVARTLPDPKAQVIHQKMESLQAALSANPAASPISPPTLGREELLRDRSIFKSLVSEVPSPQAVSFDAPAAPAGSPQPVTLGPQEMYVAEQVKYWMSNDVQSAELKLDGLGDNPVEVSISMQGNEAQVSFRTDELQTREALENASVELKDLLQREGLVLTGVSVGTAGPGDSGNQDRKPRPGPRQASVSAVATLTAAEASASKRASGRTLDIFV